MCNSELNRCPQSSNFLNYCHFTCMSYCVPPFWCGLRIDDEVRFVSVKCAGCVYVLLCYLFSEILRHRCINVFACNA